MAKIVQMNLKVPHALRAEIRAYAKSQGMQINALILRILNDAMLPLRAKGN